MVFLKINISFFVLQLILYLKVSEHVIHIHVSRSQNSALYGKRVFIPDPIQISQTEVIIFSSFPQDITELHGIEHTL